MLQRAIVYGAVTFCSHYRLVEVVGLGVHVVSVRVALPRAVHV